MTAKAMNQISITLANCFSCANGFCLVKENDTAVVLAYQRFNSGDLNDTAINNAINSYLKRKMPWGQCQKTQLSLAKRLQS